MFDVRLSIFFLGGKLLLAKLAHLNRPYQADEILKRRTRRRRAMSALHHPPPNSHSKNKSA
jgi:hypothetical protein